MMPGHYNITIRQGDTFQETFTFVATKLTSYTGLMQWRDGLGTVKVTCDSAGAPATMTIAVGASDTVITPVITSTQTAALAAGVYYYDLQLTSPTPDFIVTTWLEGTVTVVADVTIPVTP
jgi:hypothetical protein